MSGRWHLSALIGCALLGVSIAAVQTEETAGELVLPGMRADLQKRYIDLEATVILREGDWLELLACSPGTREHESILTVAARPSHIHLALITLGLEPGAPFRNELVDGRFVPVQPHGPKVAVSIVQHQDGQEREVPANEWIYDRATQQPLKGRYWMFTGSELFEHEGRTIFMADANGTVLSLVHFGDDLLARDTELTSDTDGQILTARTEAIPEVGTQVRIRLRPVEPVEP